MEVLGLIDVKQNSNKLSSSVSMDGLKISLTDIEFKYNFIDNINNKNK